MKTRIILILFVFSFVVRAQVFKLEEEFNGGTSAPGSWTFTAVGGTYTSNANYGKTSPSLQFDATNDRVLTASWSGSADQVTFFMRALNSPNAADVMLVEGWNGSAFVTIGSARPLTTARVFVFSLAANITQLRFTYTKSATNVAFDDVAVRVAGNCTGTPPTIRSIMVDACDAGTSCEGRNEFITFINGSSSLNISNFEISYPDVGTSGGDTYCGTVANSPCDNTIATNSAYTGNLNSTASPCNPFLDPPGGIIPAFANVIVFGGNGPNFTWDFSAMCASGATYYVIYANNTSDCNGRFGNSGSCPNCHRDAFIRDRSTGCTDTTYYNQSLVGSPAGSFTTVSGTGVVNYVNSGCTAGFMVLPLEITSITLSTIGDHPVLSWTTASETGITYYEIEKSYDGFNFESTGAIFYPLHSANLNEYSYEHKQNETADGIYFRIKAVSADGSEGNSSALFYSYKTTEPKIYAGENNAIEIISDNKTEKTITVSTLLGVKLLETNSVDYKTEIKINHTAEKLVLVTVIDRYKCFTKRILLGE